MPSWFIFWTCLTSVLPYLFTLFFFNLVSLFFLKYIQKQTFAFNQRIFTEMKRLVLFHSLLPACWQTNSTWRLRRRRGGSSTSSVTPDLMPRSTQNWWGSAFADPDELQITERKQPWLLIWVVTLCISLLVRALFLKYFKISPWGGKY